MSNQSDKYSELAARCILDFFTDERRSKSRNFSRYINWYCGFFFRCFNPFSAEFQVVYRFAAPIPEIFEQLAVANGKVRTPVTTIHPRYSLCMNRHTNLL